MLALRIWPQSLPFGQVVGEIAFRHLTQVGDVELMVVYHRTGIAEAHSIIKNGFEDEKWSFELRNVQADQQLKVVGVWLSDRPLSEVEGPEGDAVLEVTLDLSEETLDAFHLEGVFQDARLWVVPAELVNAHCQVRFHGVDPRASGFYEVPDEAQ